MIKEILNSNHIRATNQRVEILELIYEKKIITIKELERQLKSIDPSTIYRTLELFLNRNIIEKEIDNNKVIYSLHEGHKHYIKCIKCNEIQEIKTCPIEQSELNGFIITNHSIKIDGICKNCNK